MKSNVMVTGGSGFIGSYVCRMLASRGDFVVNFDTQPPTRFWAWLNKDVDDNITFIQGDLVEFPKLFQTIEQFSVDKIVHLAGMRGDDIWRVFNFNVIGTMNVLEAGRVMDVKNVIFPSTIGVYAPHDVTENEEPIGEDAPLKPMRPYDSSKLTAEFFGLNYSETYDMLFVALRICGAYGAGMSPYGMGPTRILIENTARKIPTVLPAGYDMRRNYVQVKDVAQAMLLALDAERGALEHRVFNISSGLSRKGDAVKLGRVVEILKDVAPEAEITVGPGIEERESQLVKVVGHPRSVERARTVLGWEPKYGLIEGLKESVKTFALFASEVSPNEHMGRRRF